MASHLLAQTEPSIILPFQFYLNQILADVASLGNCHKLHKLSFWERQCLARVGISQPNV